MSTQPSSIPAPEGVTARSASFRLDMDPEWNFIRHLIETGTISKAWDDRIRGLCQQRGQAVRPIGLLSKLGAIAEAALADALSRWCEKPRFRPIGHIEPFNQALNAPFLHAHSVCPVTVDGGAKALLMGNPFDDFARRAVEFSLREALPVHIATGAEIEELLASRSAPDSEEAQDLSALPNGSTSRWRDLAGDAPVIRRTQRLIGLAIGRRASDIHFEPGESAMTVRCRIDGLLHRLENLDISSATAVISRLKVMAALDLAETRLPQDGRISLAIGGREYDFRLASTPSHHGEGAVLRVLDRMDVKLDLDALGFSESVERQIAASIQEPNGIVLVTGPTGSGKTTTLYAALQALNDPSRKILTAEDPIEYALDGVSQLQVKPDIGLTFAGALRSFLRQDPDVIMVGEIRDRETAEIAIQAAMTGHLVLSTLHTNSAAGAITRLLDMGIEPYLLAPVLRLVVAQRLVRKVCVACHGEAKTPACASCSGTGFRGRSVVSEAIRVDDAVRTAISRSADESEIESIAGTTDALRRHAELKVQSGETTAAEIARVLSQQV